MGAPAKGPRVKWKRGWAYAHFTWNGVSYRIALHTQDKAVAAQRCAQEYADVVAGRKVATPQSPTKRLDLAQLLEEWLTTKRPTLDVRTVPTIEGYCRTFVEAFGSLDNITRATARDFGMRRLGAALRTTVLRELAYLRQFLVWAEEHQYIPAVPVVPPLPPKAGGTRTGTQRARPVTLTMREAIELVSHLPETSKTIDGRKWPLRSRFEFMRLTGLRPETISRLSVPENWTRKAPQLELANEDDKARYGRTLDLTPEAHRILLDVAPERGVIFGHHVFYKALKKAAALVLDEARARDFAPYDLRHLFAKDRLDDGAITRGVSYLLGHKRVSTTDKYLAPDRRAGAEALRARRQNRRTRTESAPAQKGKRR